MNRKFLFIFAIIFTFVYFTTINSNAQGNNTKNTTKEDRKTLSKKKNTKKEKPASKDSKKAKKSDSEKKEKEKARKLANDKIKLEKITMTLKYGVQKDRKDAIKLIHRINDKSLREKALAQLITVIEKDEDSEIKRTAITVAGDLEYKPAIPSLIKILDTTNEDVRISACYAIKKLKASEAKLKMIEILKKQDLTENSNLTDSLIIALGELDAKEIINFAIENVNKGETSKMTRERLVLFVGKTGSAAQKDFLLKLYNDDDEEMLIRSYAVKSIGTLKITSAKGDIKKRIKEIKTYSFKKRGRYYQLMMHSVATLVKLGDSDSIPLLMDSLRSNNSGIRYRAVNLIKEFNDERTIDILKYKMKHDPSPKVRRAAKKALKDKGLLDEEDKDKDKKKSDTGNKK